MKNWMKVGLVQTRPLFGEKKANVDQAIEAMSTVNADLMVLPELFNSGYQFASRSEVASLSEEVPTGYTARRLIRFARQKKLYIVAGLPEKKGRRYFNSSVLIGPSGYIDTYRKIHLFYEEKLWFSPGNKQLKVYEIGKARIGMMICFDWFFPEVSRLLALEGADILCHPSNLVLPHCPQAMMTRCLENRVFAITANRVGFEERAGKERLTFIGSSQIVSPSGEILCRASGEKAEVLLMEINPSEAKKKAINRYNHLFEDRRPDFYGPLLASQDEKEE
ncbi:MAG TPA: nitrilase-related carbon-nitrogen hydrolase [Nitrospiria bacterium]|nr:nitrilase-related carbon-nitrogen hydrolase [Nitrospiria bacterium]